MNPNCELEKARNALSVWEINFAKQRVSYPIHHLSFEIIKKDLKTYSKGT